MNISDQVKALKDELIQLRRDFHQHPELGFEEFRTAEKIEAYLRSCNLKPKRVTATGVVAVLEGQKPGPTLLMRADIDALPVEEANDLPYKSQAIGKMHACGHDNHIAMLLIAAKILSQNRDQLNGEIVFVFQPNEEGSGALPMIEAGLLEEYPADACIGLHVWPFIESGTIGVSPGPVMAGMFQFDIEIKGKGGHTGYPYQAIDPVLCAADVVQSLQIIQTREISSFEPTILMIGKIQGGSAANIIPDSVVLGGTIRFLHEDPQNAACNLKMSMERILTGVCAAHRTEYKFTLHDPSLTLVNDEAIAGIARTVALEIVESEDKIRRVQSPAGEDFSEFSSRIPGVFYFLGVGNPEKETCYPLHNPRFNVDEDVLPIGVEMHVRTALKYLE